MLQLSALLFFFWSIINICEGKNAKYIIVVDAGSTGSRLYVYEVNEEKLIGHKGTKVTPGLSSFQNNPDKVGEYMKPLFEAAKTQIPKSEYHKTLVYVRATAGMRLIPESAQNAIYDNIYETLGHGKIPFIIKRENLLTIPGDWEGYYGALSVNYLMNRVNLQLQPTNCEEDPIFGALDLGGSSTQIVYEIPSKFRCNEKIQDPLEKDRLFIHSYLAYGAEKVRERFWDMLVNDAIQEGNTNGIINNPCDFLHHSQTWKDFSLVGTGDSITCQKSLHKLFWNGLETCWETDIRPCSIMGVEQPPIPEGKQFFAMSLYFYALDAIRNLSPIPIDIWPNPTIEEIERSTVAMCALDWESSQHDLLGKHKFTEDNELANRCIQASYIIVLLRDIYGLDVSERNIVIGLTVGDTEVEWTLGSALADLNKAYRQPLLRLADLEVIDSEMTTYVFSFVLLVLASFIWLCFKYPRTRYLLLYPFQMRLKVRYH